MLLHVEAFVGDVNQLVGMISVLRERGDAVVHADADGKFEGLEGFRKNNADTAAEIDGLDSIGLGEDESELVATDAESKVGGAQGLLQSGSGGLKNLVAARMSVLVVHFLEAMKIENHKGERVAVAAGTIQFLVEGFAEEATIVKAGEGIGNGAELQLFQIVVLNENGKTKNSRAGKNVHQSSLEGHGTSKVLAQLAAVGKSVVPKLRALIFREINVSDYFEVTLEKLTARRNVQAFERVGQQLEIRVLNGRPQGRRSAGAGHSG